PPGARRGALPPPAPRGRRRPPRGLQHPLPPGGAPPRRPPPLVDPSLPLCAVPGDEPSFELLGQLFAMAPPDLARGETGILDQLGRVDRAAQPMVKAIVGGLDDEAAVSAAEHARRHPDRMVVAGLAWDLPAHEPA